MVNWKEVHSLVTPSPNWHLDQEVVCTLQIEGVLSIPRELQSRITYDASSQIHVETIREKKGV